MSRAFREEFFNAELAEHAEKENVRNLCELRELCVEIVRMAAERSVITLRKP